jgi:hypothetical protein
MNSQPKDIKEYLHLYIGCEVEAAGGKKGRIEAISIRYNVCEVFVSFGPNGAWYSAENVKPLLYMVEDLTEEQEAELKKLELELEDNHFSNIEMWAVLTNQFRKWQIDIDGLIESGLAIRKTKEDK